MSQGRIVRGTEINFDEFINYPGWNKESEYTAFIETATKY